MTLAPASGSISLPPPRRRPRRARCSPACRPCTTSTLLLFASPSFTSRVEVLPSEPMTSTVARSSSSCETASSGTCDDVVRLRDDDAHARVHARPRAVDALQADGDRERHHAVPVGARQGCEDHSPRECLAAERVDADVRLLARLDACHVELAQLDAHGQAAEIRDRGDRRRAVDRRTRRRHERVDRPGAGRAHRELAQREARGGEPCRGCVVLEPGQGDVRRPTPGRCGRSAPPGRPRPGSPLRAQRSRPRGPGPGRAWHAPRRPRRGRLRGPCRPARRAACAPRPAPPTAPDALRPRRRDRRCPAAPRASCAQRPPRPAPRRSPAAAEA